LQSLYYGVSIIERLSCSIQPISEESIALIKTQDEPKYYAIQNLLECIATLCCPNDRDGPVHFTQQTRTVLNSIGATVDASLRSLGNERNQVMHQRIEFSRVHEHVNQMLELKQMMLTNSERLGMQFVGLSHNEQKSTTVGNTHNISKSYVAMATDRKPNDELLQRAKARVEDKDETPDGEFKEKPSSSSFKNNPKT